MQLSCYCLQIHFSERDIENEVSTNSFFFNSEGRILFCDAEQKKKEKEIHVEEHSVPGLDNKRGSNGLFAQKIFRSTPSSQ